MVRSGICSRVSCGFLEASLRRPMQETERTPATEWDAPVCAVTTAPAIQGQFARELVGSRKRTLVRFLPVFPFQLSHRRHEKTLPSALRRALVRMGHRLLRDECLVRREPVRILGDCRPGCPLGEPTQRARRTPRGRSRDHDESRRGSSCLAVPGWQAPSDHVAVGRHSRVCSQQGLRVAHGRKRGQHVHRKRVRAALTSIGPTGADDERAHKLRPGSAHDVMKLQRRS